MVVLSELPLRIDPAGGARRACSADRSTNRSAAARRRELAQEIAGIKSYGVGTNSFQFDESGAMVVNTHALALIRQVGCALHSSF